MSLPNVTFVNLQYSDYQSDLDEFKTKFGAKVHDFADLDLFDDIDGVAALTAALDMVIATTSIIPIISAGVGTKTKFAVWKQSPWNSKPYHPRGPSVQIFERNTWEDWGKVFNTIAKDIQHKK
jgi:hypothetical protein